MKNLLKILLAVDLAVLAYGLWLQFVRHDTGYDFYLGLFTLILFAVIMPLFLFWRYKDKDLSQWRFKPPHEDE